MATAMIRATFKLQRPDEAEATMAITMTLGDWKRLCGQLDSSPQRNGHPAIEVIDTIKKLVEQAEARFHHQEGETP